MIVFLTHVQPHGSPLHSHRLSTCTGQEFGTIVSRMKHSPSETCFAIARIEWESDMLISTVYKLSEKSVHYRSAPDHFVSAIEEVLQVDVRSKYQTRRWTSPDYINCQIVDNIRVKYRFAVLPQSSLSTDSKTDIDTAHIQIFAVEESSTTVE